jgi:hypothetical protein
VQFKFLVALLFVASGAITLSGCGTTVSTNSARVSETDAEGVERLVIGRAQARWNALLKQDMDVAYQFISPGGRSLMSLQQYRPRVNSGFWRAAKVEKASCAAETCEVTVLVDVIFQGVKFTNPIKETWILDAGKWWFVYQG